MNKKTKKIVTGIVLGTFVIGTTSPAFADSTDNEIVSVQESPVLMEQSIPIIDSEELAVSQECASTPEIADPTSQEHGKGKIALEVIKRVLLDNWDDIPLLKEYTALKTTLFDWIDAYYDVFDTVEDVLRQAISSAFGLDPDSLVVNAAITVIMLLLPL